MRFRFKLEGQDTDWREVVNQRRVEYSNLPPRHYRFRVLACNNSGVWNEEGAALEFPRLIRRTGRRTGFGRYARLAFPGNALGASSNSACGNWRTSSI